MYIRIRATSYIGVCGCTYRRGLGVACSDTRAIPEPRNAEQQQCSPAFFVRIFYPTQKILICWKVSLDSSNTINVILCALKSHCSIKQMSV